MDISVVITCFNEEKNIRSCLNSIVVQRYDNGKYEIIVSDGGSTDRTHQIVQKFTKIHSNIRLVIETKKGTAAGRNAGVKTSQYDYIAFIDADCEAPEDWLSILVNAYQRAHHKDDKVIAVGGTNIPPDNADSFLLAIGVALDSYIGSFNSTQGRVFKEPHYVSSLANLNVLYRKGPIIDAGYYDESLFSEAEDADINFRLYSSGYRFLFIPGSFVWHKMRPTPGTWLKNMFRYGKGRARLLKRYPRMWNPSFFLPPLFALAMASMLFGPLINIFYLPAIYFPLLCLFSVIQSYRKRLPRLALYVMTAYLIQHFGYAAGEVYGLLHPNVK